MSSRNVCFNLKLELVLVRRLIAEQHFALLAAGVRRPVPGGRFGPGMNALEGKHEVIYSANRATKSFKDAERT